MTWCAERVIKPLCHCYVTSIYPAGSRYSTIIFTLIHFFRKSISHKGFRAHTTYQIYPNTMHQQRTNESPPAPTTTLTPANIPCNYIFPDYDHYRGLAIISQARPRHNCHHMHSTCNYTCLATNATHHPAYLHTIPSSHHTILHGKAGIFQGGVLNQVRSRLLIGGLRGAVRRLSIARCYTCPGGGMDGSQILP